MSFLMLFLTVLGQISGRRRSRLLFLIPEKGPRAACDMRAALWPCLLYRYYHLGREILVEIQPNNTSWTYARIQLFFCEKLYFSSFFAVFNSTYMRVDLKVNIRVFFLFAALSNSLKKFATNVATSVCLSPHF